MPVGMWSLAPPSISPLGRDHGRRKHTITSDTYIQITCGDPLATIYFSTDGGQPDPWRRREYTFKYKAPFKLKPGNRTVNAFAISRSGVEQSSVSCKSFEVESGGFQYQPSAYQQRGDYAEEGNFVPEVPLVLPEYRKMTPHRESSVINDISSSVVGSDLDIGSDVLSEVMRDMNDINLTPTVPRSPGSQVRPSRGTGRYSHRHTSPARPSPHRSPHYSPHGSPHRYSDKDVQRSHRTSRESERDIDAYFSDDYIGRPRPDTDTKRQHNSNDEYVSEDSDVETEVSNFFKESSKHGHHKHSKHSPSQDSGHGSPGPTLFTPKAVFDSDVPVMEPRPLYDDYRDSMLHRRPPGLVTDEIYNRRVGSPLTATSAVDCLMAKSNKHQSPERSKTPVKDIGYRAGYSMAEKQHSKDQDRESTTQLDDFFRTSTDNERRGRSSDRKSRYQQFEDRQQAETGIKGKDKQALKKKEESDSESDFKSSSSSPSSSRSSSNNSSKSSSKASSKSAAETGKEKLKKEQHSEKPRKEKHSKKEETQFESKEKGKIMKGEGGENKKEKEKEKDKTKKKKKEDTVKEKKEESEMLIQGHSAPVNPSTKEVASNSRTLKSQDGQMAFINDSGYQINFWGVEPGKVLKKMDKKKIPPQLKSFLPVSDDGSSVVSSGRSMVSDAPPKVKQSRKTKAYAGAPQQNLGGPVVKSAQAENQSIGNFFKKIFGKSDPKNGDPRTTVYEVGKNSGNKMGYAKIKSQCKKSGKLWEDPEFPAEDSSIYFKNKPVKGTIEWKRPHEICDDPQFFVGGASRFDIRQGVLGNCWLLSAVASVCSSKKCIRKCVPQDQSFQREYHGVFRFQFWQYGKWVEVCIDDRLPTKDGSLIFMHSVSNNEFWSTLLEKAYAKLAGCYESLSGGLASEAMTDMSGGVCERYNFKNELPDNMFQIMLKACERGSLMGASIDAQEKMEEELENGLILGHAYSITDVKLAETSAGEEELVRVRNPWGNESEWNGPWSDKSDEWNSLSAKEKKRLGLVLHDDGEFWMSFKDFATHFQRVEICNLSPDLGVDEDSDMKAWESKLLEGNWKKKVTAGGCRNFMATYPINPQFKVSITDADDNDEEEIGTIIIGLMQKGRRSLFSQGQANWTIGYEIWPIKGKGKMDKSYFQKNTPAAMSPQYINMREVCGRHRLPPGDYAIVPTTYEAGEEADFILRVFSEKPGNVIEMDQNTAIVQAARMNTTHSANPALTSQAEKQFKKYGGEDEEIDPYELQKILNKVFAKDFEFEGFDLNLCRALVTMRDTDQTGMLAKEEFSCLWDDLQTWKEIFIQYDQDKNGFFNSFELKDALKSVGYQLSNSTFDVLVTRYSDKEGHIQFDDFVAAIAKLKRMIDIFEKKETDGTAAYSLDEFIATTVYS